MEYVIFDIDGTLALRDEGPDGRSPFDWDRVGEDLPNVPVVKLAHAMYSQNYRLAFMTGRMEQCRDATQKWLEFYLPFLNDYEMFPSWPLVMRPDGDYTEDDILKKQMFLDRFSTDRIAFVVDDRDRVVKMWRSLGLTCLQVAEGEF